MHAAVSPDGTSLWVGSKKDNTGRGTASDGLPLTFDSTVRSIVSRVDLTTSPTTDELSSRIDFNDRGFPSAIAFSPLGNLGFALSLPTDRIEVFDPYLGEALFSIPSAGNAPLGLCLSPSGDRLFVHNYLSRDIAVFSISATCQGQCFAAQPLAVTQVVASETLAPDVLHGKKLFHTADDPRLNLNTYMACASCHFDGDSDGRTWDFTQMGEGLRNTTALHHAAGRGFGAIHWSANFDEGQDFENQIRSLNQGTGFLTEAEFAATSETLGEPKSGLNPDLDALAAYMESLETIPRSPHRENDGSLTPAGLRGKEIFSQLACFDCHSGAGFSDSRSRVLHDTGTLTAASGSRMGGLLPGLDTPSLQGIWSTAPYLHDGSAPDLLTVLTGPRAHGGANLISPAERADLISYLLQIDANESPPEMPGRAYFKNLAARQGQGSLPIEVSGENISSVTFHFDGIAQSADTSEPFATVPPPGLSELAASVTFADGSTAWLLAGNFSAPTPAPILVNFQPDGEAVPSGIPRRHQPDLRTAWCHRPFLRMGRKCSMRPASAPMPMPATPR